MRIKFTRLIAFIVVFANLIVIYYSLRLFVSFGGFQPYKGPTIRTTTKTPIKHISKLVTVIIREFELYENDVSATVHSLLNVFPSIQVFVLYDALPYPPLEVVSGNYSAKNVIGVNLAPRLKVPFIERYPVLQIKTKYVLFVPDSTRISSRQSLQSMVLEVAKQPETIVVAPVAPNRNELGCLRVNVSIREWTLKYSSIKGDVCDAIKGKHIAMMETELLKKITDPFLLPFPQSLYLQTAPMSIKVKVVKALSLQDGKPLLRSHHAQWKQKQMETERIKRLYELFTIKQVVRETGTTEWYGCTRETARCFGPILDLMPSYLFEGKWTPPCCLSNLRKTARHVFTNLDECGIRYWLEAGSLLGAMRSGDILPWDHDVDVGFNRDDLGRSQWLRKAQDKPVVDSKGFLWEKATEGNFYRVHYSKTNKIFVNLFPFYPRNGTMTKDSWFTSHKNMEFPDNFLHPMSSIDFIGRQVPSPNNIRDFLEHKFGKGAIENPEYPNPSRLPFP